MAQPRYVSNPVLNDEISYHEIKMVLQNVKNKKSTGLDRIPNEVLKKQHNISCVRFCKTML